MGGTGNSSADDGKSERESKGFTKVCYYELLAVEKTADMKAIAKGYKKASLKWHPDKNPNEDTTEKFQAINEAYQCLSDTQSRAWYDSHRDQILRGKDPGDMNENDENYITKSKLKPFFDMKSSWPGGFDAAAEKNAYTVFTVLFAQLDREEEAEEAVGTKHFKAPAFGASYSTAEEVFAFYDCWESFNSIKPFAYADVYDSREAPNRRVKRLIEVEN